MVKLLVQLLLALLALPALAEPAAPAGLCEKVARLENGKSLDSILLPPVSVRPWSDANNPEDEYEQRDYSVDINNDGRRERVVVRRLAADAHAELTVSDASGAAIDFGAWLEGANLADLAFLKHMGRNYLVVRERASYPSRVRERLAYLARIGPDNVVHPLCHFAAERLSSSHLRAGAAPVCEAVLAGRVQYPPFDTRFSLTHASPQPDGMAEWVAVNDQAASVDIDNDGAREFVARVEHSIVLSHGCGNHKLAVIDPDLSALQADGLPEPRNFEADVCADESLRPFRFEGATYIERRFNPAFPRDFHNVVQIKDGQWLTACSFEVRRRYFVASAYQVFTGDHEAWMNYPREARDADEIHELWRRLLEENQGRLADDMLKEEPGFPAALADPAHAYPLLLEAVDSGQPKMVEWLLRHGVSANAPDAAEGGHHDSALEEALRAESPEMVLLLLRHGADPAEVVGDLLDFTEEQPQSRRRAVMLAMRRLGYLPDEVISHAAEEDPTLLSQLAASGLPIERGDYGWENGVEDPIEESSWTLGDDLSPSTRASVLSSLRQLKRAGVRPGADSDLAASYEVEGRSWVVQGRARNPEQVDDFLMFVTSFCALHLPANCGSDALLRKARRWFKSLAECAPEFREEYGERTCRLYEQARRVAQAGNEMNWRSFEGESLAVARPLGTWHDVKRFYPAKDWP